MVLLPWRGATVGSYNLEKGDDGIQGYKEGKDQEYGVQKGSLPSGEADRLTGPSLPLGGLPALGSPQDFTFCPMLQTILAQLLSDLGPVFGISLVCPVFTS